MMLVFVYSARIKPMNNNNDDDSEKVTFSQT